MSKTISIGLSKESIQQAVKELKQYKSDLKTKVEKFVSSLATRLQLEVESGFNTAPGDDVLNGEARKTTPTVTVVESGKYKVKLVASGGDVMFLEFGAGVYHNTDVGTSPHPKGSEFGFTIGSYGIGKGANKVWGYYDGNELVLTHGTPASMPMYHAVERVRDEIEWMAREAFQ